MSLLTTFEPQTVSDKIVHEVFPLSSPMTCTAGSVCKGAFTVTYGTKVIARGNTTDPTSLIVFLHGLGGTPDKSICEIADHIYADIPNTLIVLPAAPRQPVTVNGGCVMPAWSDVDALGPKTTSIRMVSRDVNGLATSAEYVYRLAADLAGTYGIPTSKICFCGLSQGGATAMAAGLTAPYVPAAVVALSGFLPTPDEIIAAGKACGQVQRVIDAKTPFTMIHGDADVLVPMVLAEGSMVALKEAGIVGAELAVRPGMEHVPPYSEWANLGKLINGLGL